MTAKPRKRRNAAETAVYGVSAPRGDEADGEVPWKKNGAGGIYGPMAVEGLGRWGRVYRPYHWRDSGIGCGARRCAAGAGGVSSLVYW